MLRVAADGPGHQGRTFCFIGAKVYASAWRLHVVARRHLVIVEDLVPFLSPLLPGAVGQLLPPAWCKVAEFHENVKSRFLGHFTQQTKSKGSRYHEEFFCCKESLTSRSRGVASPQTTHPTSHAPLQLKRLMYQPEGEFLGTSCCIGYRNVPPHPTFCFRDS